jgi:D-alanine-D-alanine ligase-like ATP-grasp enzyme
MGIDSDKHASYKLLGRELKALGYTMSEEHDDNRLFVSYISPKGRIWRARAAMIDYPFTSATVRSLSKNKAEATKFVTLHGMHAPATIKVVGDAVDMTSIEKFLNRYSRVVVKPLNRSLSIGLTTDITTMLQLQKAIKKAAKYSSEVLVQEQVFGEEVRFAVINGKVVSSLLRRTPQVVGDGSSTISELIKRENLERRKINYTLVPYPQLTDELVRKSVDPTKVPAAGEIVELSRATMISKGCSVYDILGEIDESYIRLVESLVEDLDTGFIVVDIFIKNFREPAREDNYWFIEFNTSPVLKLFYSCRDGNMHDILPALAEAIDRKMHATSKHTLGSFEKVSIPSLGIKDTIAKIDTGAYSGALSCSEAKVVRKGGRKVLQFSPGLRSKKVYETDKFSQKHVRSSNGQRERRYLIETELVIGDRTYPVAITLSDRSDMKHEILIGRRFLREHNLLVDVTLNQEYDTDSEAK